MNPKTKEILIVYQAPWDWHFLWNRSQPLAEELSKHCTVVYLDPGITEMALTQPFKRFPLVPQLFRRLDLGQLSSLGDSLYLYKHRDVHSDVWGLTVRDRSRIGYKILKHQLRTLRKKHQKLWLLTCRPAAEGLLKLFDWDRVIVDIEDPWMSLGWKVPPTESQIRHLLERADIIFSNGPKLVRDFAGCTQKSIYSLLNGLDRKFLEIFSRGSLQCPHWMMRGTGRKKAVYTGHITNRLDFELLEDLISSTPECDYYFVGQDALHEFPTAAWRSILKKPNVFFHGIVPHRELPAVLHHADILLLPHKGCGGHLMFPAKLFEYLAAGKWILSSVDFTEELGSVPGLVWCQSLEEYQQMILGIISGDKVLKDEERLNQKKIASANTWDRRAEEFIQAVKESEIYANR